MPSFVRIPPPSREPCNRPLSPCARIGSGFFQATPDAVSYLAHHVVLQSFARSERRRYCRPGCISKGEFESRFDADKPAIHLDQKLGHLLELCPLALDTFFNED